MSSSAPSRKPASPEPSFDLDYSIHDFQPEEHLDSTLFFERIEEAMVQEGTTHGGRVLDVACGTGQVAVRLRRKGVESWGLDASLEMLGLSRWVHPDSGVVLVRGIAEALPFRTGSFDRVVCQGALDHFLEPRAFIREAARITSPSGRVVIALANYESLSCRLGRLRELAGRVLFRRPESPRRYWLMPADHFHRGDPAFIRGLGGPWLRLERWHGLSLLWLLDGWAAVLHRLPRDMAKALWLALDKIAYRTPALADMIVSVWRVQEKQQGP